MPVGDEFLHEDFNFKNSRHIVLSLLLVVFAISVNVLFFSLKNTVFKASADETLPPSTYVPKPVKVLSLSYLPPDLPEASGEATPSAVTDATLLDAQETGINWGITIGAMRARVEQLKSETVNSLNNASKFRGYKRANADQAVNYSIVDHKEFLKAAPVKPLEVPDIPPKIVPFPDEYKMLTGADSTIGISNICDYVDNQGVKEVWVWVYHTDNIVPRETNMAPKLGGAFGSRGYEDVSVSWKIDDLPRCNRTYTVMEYNYGRNVSLHNHGHHFEQLFQYADKDSRKYWFDFSEYGLGGSAKSCGMVHFPPNVVDGDDYNYESATNVSSDCEDWNPGMQSGQLPTKNVNCHTWQGSGQCNRHDEDGHRDYMTWWMQNLPGANNGMTVGGKQFGNIWNWISDFDDNKPMFVEITSPTQLETKTASFTAQASVDYNGPVQKVEFYASGALMATDTTAPYSAEFNLDYIPLGNFQIYAKAYVSDKVLGGVYQSSSVTVNNQMLDSVEPLPYIVKPVFNSVFTDSKVDFEVGGWDNRAVKNILVDIRTFGWGKSYLVTPTNNKFTDVLPDGAFELTLTAIDYTNQLNLFEDYVIFFKVSADPDKDGFTTKVENVMGTDPHRGCGVNAYPPDFNNDKNVNSGDQLSLGLNYIPGQYRQRYDLNGDGAVNAGDKLVLARFIGKKCTDLSSFQALTPMTIQEDNCSFIFANSSLASGVTFKTFKINDGVDMYMFMDGAGRQVFNPDLIHSKLLPYGNYKVYFGADYTNGSLVYTKKCTNDFSWNGQQ